MPSFWSEKIDAVLSVGHSLNEVGVNNWALSRDQALAALDHFEAEKVPVLGGDVYEFNDGRLESNYDNWYCNRADGEAKSDFVSRSIGVARDYITKYKPSSAKEYFFVVVPQC